jgi:hypothetical protein
MVESPLHRAPFDETVMVKFRGGRGQLTLLRKNLIIILIVASSWGAFSFATWLVSPTRDLPKVVESRTDSFDPKEGPGVASEGRGLEWIYLVGEWTNAGSALSLSRMAGSMNLAVVEAGSQASIQARVTGTSYCGLAANVADARNYIALLRAMPFGLWNVMEVIDGEAERRGTLPDASGATVEAQLRVDDGKVWAFVGSSVASFALASDSIGTSAGFVQSGESSPPCSFDDAVLMTLRR